MAAETLVWADIRKNIEVLQLVVSLKTLKDKETTGKQCGKSKSTEITVSHSNIVVKCGEVTSQKHVNEKDTCGIGNVLVSFQDITVDPMSCQGLSIVQDKELQMRLHINNSQNLSSNDSDGSKIIEEERKSLQKGPVKMVCKLCGNTVVEKRQFKRVLELPSEQWQQISQNLCCHGNVSNLSSLQEASFSPSENDCFLGSYFIMVNADVVEAKHLIITQGETEIKCHRCTTPIGDIVMRDDGTGETQVKGIRINKHAITIQNGDVFKSYTTEVYLSKLLQAKLQGRVNFKFLVKGTSQNGESKAYALLWILNADAAVITNISPVNSKHMEQFNGLKTHNNDDPTRATTSHGMKVLYKILLNSTNKELKKSAGREIINLPSEMCLQLLLILTSSTYSIPPTARLMEGFMVGYLKS